MNHLPFINNDFVLSISDQIIAKVMAKCSDFASSKFEKVYHIEAYVDDLKGSKLPSNKQV